MSCVGSPPAIRGSIGRPLMPNASSALVVPSDGGFLPPSVDDHAKRTSSSDVVPGVKVAPSASCLLRA